MPAKRWAGVMAVLLVAYLVMTGARGVDFIRAGGMSATLGVAILVFPVVGGWVLLAEWRFGAAAQRLAEELAKRGELPADDLPRRPSGRAERAAADARFDEVRARLEAGPESWPLWFELATAYDACGDRRRARAAMRRAISLSAAQTAPDR